jgi:two-component system, response regulator PdtaR
MTRSLRIAVADDDPDMRDYFRTCLKRLGHQAVIVATNGRDLVEQCRTLQPDLVITDIKMPHMDGIDAATRIYRERPVPVILVSAYHDPALVEHADADHIQASLVKPIRQANLKHAIVLAMRRFEQLDALRQEAGNLLQAMEHRTVIAQATSILMQRGGLDEQHALRQR